MHRTPRRREFLKDSLMVTAAVAALRKAGGEEGPQPAGGKLPTIRLGTLEVSRLILGSNPFFGFAHGNPQASDEEMRRYFTPERIMAVLDQAAEQGVEAVWTPSYDHWIKLWTEYRARGGRMKIWIGQPDHFDGMKDHIRACAENGAQAVCIQGECAGRAIREGRFDLVREWLELIKSFGLPAGLASHQPEYVLQAEETGLPAEFYHLTVGVPDSFRPEDRERALDTMGRIDKPMVAFKVLGAGRFPPHEAFPYVLQKLRRKDGLCVGMFPAKQPDQVRENATLANRLMQA